ncbi:MAG TPA: hypothetical protein VFX49_06345 [Chloroflexota bacterium]|nr:hypothetical protein [Chloroflexota bacterium]
MADPAPRRSIRRFDVFAEYRKQEEEERGLPEDEAKGYGLWVAKVVAARVYGRGSAMGSSKGGKDGQGEDKEHRVDGKWHTLSDEVQDDRRFDAEVVRRMGEEFYERVFAPAIRQAREAGKSYEAIRDSIRREWRPEPVKLKARATGSRTAAGKVTKAAKTAKRSEKKAA